VRAVVYRRPDEVRVESVPEPGPPGPHDALVRVTTAAICGTDLHVTHGEFPGVDAGMIVGHEFVGRVVAIGDHVHRLAVGDEVMASDFSACGRCRWCDRREHWHCGERAFFGTGTSFGPALAGAQAELVRVPFADTTLARVPAGLSHEAALLLGDNLATAWAALSRARLAGGERVAVVGGGPIGQLTAACALATGAGAVVLIEPTPARRALAEARGALVTTPEEAERFVRSVTDGDGADVVVEAVGHPKTLESSLALVRRAGRVVSAGAHATEQWPFPLAASFTKELTLSFVIGDSIRYRDQLARMVAAGALDPTFVIDSHVPLEQAPEAYAALRAQRAMKVVLRVG
jgi:2-desacetyl-2-hydroxyethyl bacteriochlorophyllide A dehydrogenase